MEVTEVVWFLGGAWLLNKILDWMGVGVRSFLANVYNRVMGDLRGVNRSSQKNEGEQTESSTGEHDERQRWHRTYVDEILAELREARQDRRRARKIADRKTIQLASVQNVLSEARTRAEIAEAEVQGLRDYIERYCPEDGPPLRLPEQAQSSSEN